MDPDEYDRKIIESRQKYVDHYNDIQNRENKTK